MAIDAIDLIVPTRAADLPAVCEIIGNCGMVFAVKVNVFSLHGEEFLATITDIETGIVIESDPNKVWNLLVPDSLCDPATQAEIILALHNEGIDF
jgi:hypothetical protein